MRQMARAGAVVVTRQDFAIGLLTREDVGAAVRLGFRRRASRSREARAGDAPAGDRRSSRLRTPAPRRRSNSTPGARQERPRVEALVELLARQRAPPGRPRAARGSSGPARACWMSSQTFIALRCTIAYASSRVMPVSTSASSTRARVDEPARRLEVREHALRIDHEPVEDPLELAEDVVERDEAVRRARRARPRSARCRARATAPRCRSPPARSP